MSSSASSDPYTEFGYDDAAALGCADYVAPTVCSLLGTLDPGTRVLDVGCGNGALAGQFIDIGCEVVGIDLSERGIAIARETHPAGRFELVPANEDVLDVLGEAPFDVVVSTEVIEHLYAPAAFLAGCYSALRPGGRVALSTPYHGWVKNVLIAVSGKSDFHFHPLRQGGHIKFWSRKTLTEALTGAGFANPEFAGAGRLPYLWKSMVMAAQRP